MRGKLSYIIPGLLVVIGIFAWGGGIALSSQTLSPRWGALTAALVLALTSLHVTLKRAGQGKKISEKALRSVAHVFIAGGIGYFAILGINRLGATEDKAETVTGEVTQRLRHTHTRQRRVGRNRYVADGHYYTYGALITLPDGTQTEQHLSLDEYNRLKTGSRRQVKIARGWLGMPVVLSVRNTKDNARTGSRINRKIHNEAK